MSAKRTREKSHMSAASKASASGVSTAGILRRSRYDPEQSKRFLEAAKAHGADETPKGAEKAFKAVVKPRKSAKQRVEDAKRVVQEDIDVQRAILKKLRKPS
ncbi:putative exported protein of unknown function (plasmid) [Bradyrhizobium sp. BTAi1]|nr:hypothetical protein [Bradyrhizobium sp. BTAi1]ABQ39766.1 putative exported protein of unknown function [Bradyrhizobium sp. BTAi1]